MCATSARHDRVSKLANTTWNPADKSGSITLSGGNLIATSAMVLGAALSVQWTHRASVSSIGNARSTSHQQRHVAGLASSKTATNFNLSGSGGASVGTTGVSKNTGTIFLDGSVTVVLDGVGSTTIAWAR